MVHKAYDLRYIVSLAQQDGQWFTLYIGGK